jgi:hypothetical protein
MNAQTEMTFTAESPEVAQLRALLAGGHWLTRRLIMQTLGWPERKVPAVLQALGAEVVRSRTHGFKLTALLTKEEIPIALHAAEEVLSQCGKNTAYAVALKQRLHALIS